MKDYYSLFVKLSLQQCRKEDYVDKRKVRQHNAAVEKLISLEKEMKNIDCTAVLKELLQHDDERVKINAATFCIQIGVLLDEAKKILIEVSSSSLDSTMQFCADMILQQLS